MSKPRAKYTTPRMQFQATMRRAQVITTPRVYVDHTVIIEKDPQSFLGERTDRLARVEMFR